MAGVLDGKVALVTGGSSGMGAAIAQLFLDEGARVVVASRHVGVDGRLGESSDGRMMTVRCDVTV